MIKIIIWALIIALVVWVIVKYVAYDRRKRLGYKKIVAEIAENYRMVSGTNGLLGIIYKFERVVLDYEYGAISRCAGQMDKYKICKGDKVGYFDLKTEKIVATPQYKDDAIEYMGCNCFRVQQADGWGVIKHDKPLIPFEYKEVILAYHNSRQDKCFFWVDKGEGRFLINEKNQVVVPVGCKLIGEYSTIFFVYKRDDICTLVDAQGRPIKSAECETMILLLPFLFEFKQQEGKVEGFIICGTKRRFASLASETVHMDGRGTCDIFYFDGSFVLKDAVVDWNLKDIEVYLSVFVGDKWYLLSSENPQALYVGEGRITYAKGSFYCNEEEIYCDKGLARSAWAHAAAEVEAKENWQAAMRMGALVPTP